MEFPRNPVTMRCQFVRRQIPAEAEIKMKANEAYDDSESEQTPSFMNMDEKQYGFVTPTRDDQEMPEFPNFSDLSESSSTTKQFETIEDETSTLKTSKSDDPVLNNRKPVFNDKNLDQSEDEDEIDDEICKTIDDSELISPSINIGEEQYGFVTPTRDDQEMPEFPDFSDPSESSSAKQFDTIEDETSTLKTNESVGSARNNRRPFFNDNNLDQSEDEDEIDDEICKTIDDSESISLPVNMDEKQYEFVMLTRDDQEMTEFSNFSDLSNSISSQQDEMEAIVVDEASTLKNDGIDEPMRIHKKPIICDKNLEESEDEDEMEDEINSDYPVYPDYPENHIDGLLSTCGLSGDSVV